MSDQNPRGLRGKPSYVTDADLENFRCIYGGVPGPKGEPGRDGMDGRDGDRGIPGPQGPQGKQGCDGPQGIEGKRGVAGTDGRNGIDGKDGRDGRDGERGPMGNTGPQGAKGCDGKDGVAGSDGAPGATGPEGPQGEKGEQGEQGPQGIQGEKGDKGDTGLTGPVGPVGPQGEKGDQGDKGDTGETGPTGPAGLNGADGADGGLVTAGSISGQTLTLLQSNGDPVMIDVSGLGEGGGSGSTVTGFTGPTQNADGTLTVTLNQTEGGPRSFTLPAYPQDGGTAGVVSCVTGTDAQGDFVQLQQNGVDLAGCKLYQGTQGPQGIQGIRGLQGPQGTQGIQGPPGADGQPANLANLRVKCIVQDSGFTISLVDLDDNLVVPAQAFCPWPSTIVNANGTGGNNVSWVREPDPENPCVDRVRFSDGVQEDCIVAPYMEPESCAVYCVTVDAGDTVTVSLTTIDGYSIQWGENGVDSQVAGGANQSDSYQYLTAGTYELKVCQNSFCEGDQEEQASDFVISGAQSIQAKCCG